ncbi:MAG: FecR domain-containing protein [Bacteroidales bacterium]|nr:FecR domain-containing protein [Bacteroidales bacterium]
MKKNKQIEQLSDREWADAAAWLSGEKGFGDEAARLLLSEDGEIMKKWNDLKQTDTDIIDVDKAWDKLNGRIEAEKPVITIQRRSFIQTFARIAAMVIIAAGMGWLLFEVAAPEKITVTSAADEKNIEVLLADGSKIYLNRDSRLTYPKEFGRSSRKVSLRGEAFFDISPDASKPFIIDAGKASVSVLGTAFNVMTDNGHSEVEVYVSSGKVLLASTDGSKSVTLEPEYVGKLSDTGSSQARNTNANYLSWHTGMLVYDGERLEVVFEDLRRTFNIDITAGDPAINDYRLTSPFEHQPHDTIIKLICTTFNLRSSGAEGSYTLYPGQVQ